MQSSISLGFDTASFEGGKSRNRLKWVVIIGFWTFFGLLNGSQLYLGLKMEAEVGNISFWKIFGTQLLGWWSWIPLTPVILLLARRFPLERGTWHKTLPIHVLACVLISATQVACFTCVSILIAPFGRQFERSFWEMFIGRATSQFHINLLIYAATIGVSHAVSYYFRFREREFRASQLEAQLAQAQLQTLKMQLQPHFLFNTLNAIAGLVRDSRNKAAVDMLAGLSDLLRYTLENAGKQEVPLKEELEFLELYLDIQQMRFSDRLTVDMQVMPETLDAVVPNLILQPLVENAIRHGISRRAAAGTVGVSAHRDEGLLRLTVFDDGPGLSRDDGAPPVEGVGLSNTRARLAQLYGDRQRFTLTEREGGGVEVKLVIPFKRSI
jgi:two-component system, LytTR family, sensor kinase